VKLAIISLSTFGYFERMAIAMTKRGVEAQFFDERPANDVLSKLVMRFATKRLVRKLARRHVEAQLNRIINGGFTHVLLVFAEVVSTDDIQFLRAAGLRISRYTWDSLRNRPNVAEFDPFMDAVGSFDPHDCAVKGYTYIPLYCEHINPEGVLPHNDRPIDFYFCGTAHTDRAALISRMKEISLHRNWRTVSQLFYHSRLLYAVRHWNDKRALALFNQISSDSFALSDIIAHIRKAKVVVDVHHANQSGLTMRTFEALAQGAVLLTTNQYAADLIDPALRDRVVFLDRNAVEASMAEALNRHSGPLAAEQYETLSQDRFLRQIFDLVGLAPVGIPI
jgi:phage terminase large subunit-like protein